MLLPGAPSCALTAPTGETAKNKLWLWAYCSADPHCRSATDCPVFVGKTIGREPAFTVSKIPDHNYFKVSLRAGRISAPSSSLGCQNSSHESRATAAAEPPPNAPAILRPSARAGDGAGMDALDAERTGAAVGAELLAPAPLPRLKRDSNWLRDAASLARLWLAAVDCSTMAAFCCVP